MENYLNAFICLLSQANRCDYFKDVYLPSQQRIVTLKNNANNNNDRNIDESCIYSGRSINEYRFCIPLRRIINYNTRVAYLAKNLWKTQFLVVKWVFQLFELIYVHSDFFSISFICNFLLSTWIIFKLNFFLLNPISKTQAVKLRAIMNIWNGRNVTKTRMYPESNVLRMQGWLISDTRPSHSHCSTKIFTQQIWLLCIQYCHQATTADVMICKSTVFSYPCNITSTLVHCNQN